MVSVKRNVIPLIIVFAAVLVYAILRLMAGFNYQNPDEVIPQQVIAHIFETGSWDTNWALADLPVRFKYNQYNFSSYIIISSLLTKIVDHWNAIHGPNDLIYFLRLLSFVWQILCIILTFFVGQYLMKSRSVGVIAACSVAMFPLLFQDSLYARPESFTTALTLLFVLLFVKATEKHSATLFTFMGAILGFLIACKVTFVVLLLLPLSHIISLAVNERKVPGSSLFVFSAGTLAGFVLGAPFALFNLHAYLSGLESLFSQYSGKHPPHGLPLGNITDRFIYACQYFLASGTASTMVLSIGCFYFLLKRKLYLSLLTVLPFFGVIIYFSIKPVFFERNFSFAIPVISICCGWSIFEISKYINSLRWSRTLFVFLSLFTLYLPAAFIWQLNSAVMSGRYVHQRDSIFVRLEVETKRPVRSLGYMMDDDSFKNFSNIVSSDPKGVIYEIYGANDDYTRRFLEEASTRLGMGIIKKLSSPFSSDGLPPCTFYTYHAPDFYYITQLEYSCAKLLIKSVRRL